MSKCQYAEQGKCDQATKIDGFCLAHSVLFLWLIEGDDADEDRIREHDAIAGLSPVELERTLRGPVWGPRIEEVLRGSRWPSVRIRKLILDLHHQESAN